MDYFRRVRDGADSYVENLLCPDDGTASASPQDPDQRGQAGVGQTLNWVPQGLPAPKSKPARDNTPEEPEKKTEKQRQRVTIPRKQSARANRQEKIKEEIGAVDAPQVRTGLTRDRQPQSFTYPQRHANAHSINGKLDPRTGFVLCVLETAVEELNQVQPGSGFTAASLQQSKSMPS